jgi:hypothetical protein
MAFSPLSFLLGVAAASLVPVLSRVMRPLAVEVTAAGMGMVEDARRVAAEQLESLEDILAEARARREHLDAEATAADEEEMAEHGDDTDAVPEAEHEEPATAGRPRRRTNGAGRRRAS